MKKYIEEIKNHVSKHITDQQQLQSITQYIRTTVEKQLATELQQFQKKAIPLQRFQVVNDKKKQYQKQLNQYKSKFKPQDIQQLTSLRQKVSIMQKKQYDQKLKKWSQVSAYFNVDDKHKDYQRRSKLASRFAKTNEQKQQLTAEQIQKNLEIYQILKDAGSITEVTTQNDKQTKVTTPNPTNKQVSKQLTIRQQLQKMHAI